MDRYNCRAAVPLNIERRQQFEALRFDPNLFDYSGLTFHDGLATFGVLTILHKKYFYLDKIVVSHIFLCVSLF